MSKAVPFKNDFIRSKIKLVLTKRLSCGARVWFTRVSCLETGGKDKWREVFSYKPKSMPNTKIESDDLIASYMEVENKRFINYDDYKRVIKEAGNIVLCECKNILNDKSDMISDDDGDIYSFRCDKCFKISSFNYTIAPVPILFDINLTDSEFKQRLKNQKI